MPGKLIFISGLTGAGKTTLVGAALSAIDNLEVLLTYTTRMRREYENDSYQYVFVSADEYSKLKLKSTNWDETVYNGIRYASDAARYISDLENDINIIVCVTPNLEDVRLMAQIYKTTPVTIWINTKKDIAQERVYNDPSRSSRAEDESVKESFDIIFEPTGSLKNDSSAFIDLIKSIIRQV